MATQKEQMILRALMDVTRFRKHFRNKDLTAITGLNRQDVNYYLKKWEERGFILKGELTQGYIVGDLDGLIADILTGVEPAQKATHAKWVAPFDKDRLNTLTRMTDLHAALKALGMTPSMLKGMHDYLQDAIDEAINELRNERSYLHTRRMNPKKAAIFVDGWNYGDYGSLVDMRLVEIYVEKQLDLNKKLEATADD